MWEDGKMLKIERYERHSHASDIYCIHTVPRPCFTDEGTGAQRHGVICPGAPALQLLTAEQISTPKPRLDACPACPFPPGHCVVAVGESRCGTRVRSVGRSALSCCGLHTMGHRGQEPCLIYLCPGAELRPGQKQPA